DQLCSGARRHRPLSPIDSASLQHRWLQSTDPPGSSHKSLAAFACALVLSSDPRGPGTYCIYYYKILLKIPLTMTSHSRGRFFRHLGIIRLNNSQGPSMPIYEYICEDCQNEFEKIVINKHEEITCPKCAGKKNKIQLSVFATANGNG